MVSFSARIRDRRLELGLGVRELARHTFKPHIPSPIKSAIYISRIESDGNKHMPVESVTIDKMWAIGCVLQINPFELFLLSREQHDKIKLLSQFGLRECDPNAFGEFIRNRRTALDLSMRDAVAKSPDYISVGYWSQMETDFRECTTKISGDKLWGMGIVLDVDPTLLYVLSRKIDPRYLKADSRDRLFS